MRVHLSVPAHPEKLVQNFTASLPLWTRKLCQSLRVIRVDCSGPVAQIGKACCLEGQAPRALLRRRFGSLIRTRHFFLRSSPQGERRAGGVGPRACPRLKVGAARWAEKTFRVKTFLSEPRFRNCCCARSRLVGTQVGCYIILSGELSSKGCSHRA